MRANAVLIAITGDGGASFVRAVADSCMSTTLTLRLVAPDP